jgi:hypothetical protein
MVSDVLPTSRWSLLFPNSSTLKIDVTIYYETSVDLLQNDSLISQKVYISEPQLR